ncbi:helix-turn-helix domain-containing protein [Novosphingobium sp. FSY-8]|uniref:Helix-turn-helix domain-containing protein n=1 Tax=Novosphingobium ovatum TaxID=1908523 RepID=A0ABW9XDU9_9SPHN|nr:helix-turn-helix domain-containing protein [Novosphingobium ovatum]NBC36706.1 helix-turn-helix domain-containing protein [Novosphingobium ovatum]
MSQIERFSTADVADCDRLDFWNRLTDQTYPGTLVDRRHAHFEAEMLRWTLGDLTMIRPRSRSSLVTRRPTGERSERVVLHFQHSGRSRHEQFGRAAELNVGDFVLSSADEPYRIDLLDHEFLVVEFPRAGLAARLPKLDDVMSRRIPGNAPSSRMLHSFILSLWQQGNQTQADPEWQAGVCNVFLDLVSLAVRGMEMHQPTAAALGQRVLRVIETKLHDPTLGTAELAAEAGVSVRTIQNLFAGMGTTPSAFILSRRLERAAEMLVVNPVASVTAIAFDLGFSDSGYFARCFRQHFGLTPTQYRAQH